jgi:hypothetical protein
MLRFCSRWGLCILVLPGLGGCSEPPQRVPVAGTVTIDGRPLTSGLIQAVPDDGRPAAGKIASDGTFRLESPSNETVVQGVVPGKYRLAISAFEVVDEDSDDVNWLAPSHYANFRTSGLEIDVTGPQEDLVIELSSDVPESEENADTVTEGEVEDVSQEQPAAQSGGTSDSDAAKPAE